MKKEIIEEWRNIIGFEGLYQVSNLGRVKSLKDRYNNPREIIMKQNLMKDGYYQIGLWKNSKVKNYFVHRLVAIAFIPNPDNLPFINHIDEDKTNNCVDNLEWCTASYNNVYGNRIEKYSKPILQFDLEGNLVNEFPSIKEAERQTGFKNPNICNCLKGKRKTCGGFIWKYKKK